jgi:hypothetical protein
MKGYRTPSWFRIKGRVKERQAKAQSDKPQRGRIQMRKRYGATKATVETDASKGKKFEKR